MISYGGRKLRKRKISHGVQGWASALANPLPHSYSIKYNQSQPSNKKLDCVKSLIYSVLGDPGADNGGEGKSKRAEKYGMKKSKEQREEPLGTMSYQTSSKRSPPFWLLIGARKLLCFSAQSKGRTAATIWNWSGKTLSPGALLTILYFSSCHIFPPV